MQRRRPVLNALAISCALWSLPLSASAQSEDETERYALVIGNGSYTALPSLPSASADAATAATTLRDAGFEVTELLNVTQGDFLAANQRFVTSIDDDDIVFYYFSGHALQFNGNNFLLPSNVRIDGATSLLTAGVPLSSVVRQLSGTGAREIYVVIEAGAQIDLVASGDISPGLAVPRPSDAPVMYMFSAAPGAVRQAPADPLAEFTTLLFETLAVPGTSVEDAMAEVLAAAESGGATPPPWFRNGIEMPLVLFEGQDEPPLPPPTELTAEEQMWQRINELEDQSMLPTLLQSYLLLYPDGEFAADAVARLAALEQAAADGPDNTGNDTPDDTPNQAPEMVEPNPLSIWEGASEVAFIMPEPTDPDGDPLQVEIIDLPELVDVATDTGPLSEGEVLDVDVLSTLIVSAADGTSGSDEFVIRVVDPDGASVAATLHITVEGRPNRPPIAFDSDPIELPADGDPVALNFATPTDPDDDALAITVTELPSAGTVALPSGELALFDVIWVSDLGELTYAPDGETVGPVGRLALSVADGYDGVATMAVEISLTEPEVPDGPPVAEITEVGAELWSIAATTRDDRIQLQRALGAIGFYDGALDGILGRQSQEGIAAYQATIDAEPTGELTNRQRAMLSVDAAKAVAAEAEATAAAARDARDRTLEVLETDDIVEIPFVGGSYRGQADDQGLNGLGTLEAGNGQSFTGEFRDNEPVIGVHAFDNGDRYEGMEAARKPEGLGVWYYANGIVYSGEWEDGRISGLGVNTSPGGVVISGLWSANRPAGFGGVTDANGLTRYGLLEGDRFLVLY